MTPAEHAAEAERLMDAADQLDGLKFDSPEYAIVTAIAGLTHAVLALRTEPAPAPPPTEGGAISTVAEVNAYVNGSRDAVESVVEGLVGDRRALLPRAELISTMRGFLADIADSRQQMIQRVTDRPGEPA